MSFPKHDSNEQANISGAAIMLDDCKLLRELYRLLRSYNPDLPMGSGMRANFIKLRNELDERRLYLG